MDFKEELVRELGLGVIAEETMLEEYVKACEAIAARYHESEVKNLDIQRVINWVAITDRIPPRPDEDYLVVMRNKNKDGGIALQDVKNFTSDGTWVGGNNWENVVAWAELPEPPCL